MRFLRLAPRLSVALVTLMVWTLAAGSIVFWLLRLGASAPRLDAPVAGAAGPSTGVDTAAVARALGALESRASAPVTADIGTRLVLQGILTHGAGGAALIAVDGQPARPLRVGATVEGLDGGWTLRSVAPHAVVLGADGREARLELPPFSERSRAGDAIATPPRRTTRAPVRTPMTSGRPLGVPAPSGVPSASE